MSIDQQRTPYDETYYRVGCGIPYERNDHWLTFFGKIADAIVREINPGSVLDAGCAMGFLVEALRQRGVEAYGVDISEYAISQVAEEIKPYCWVGSLTEPLPRRYDLVVTVEVLEHLPAAEAPQAIRNLCAAADDILFSSTPDDYSEATHFSVHPPEVWASMFAEYGFWHDVEFEPAFLTPWAMRFRKSTDPTPRALIPLERALWRLRRENTSLRELVNSARDTPGEMTRAELQKRVAQLEGEHEQSPEMQAIWTLLGQAFSAASAAGHAESLHREVVALATENYRLTAELRATHGALSGFLAMRAAQESRITYKALNRALKAVDLALPEGSRRSRAWRNVSRTLKGQRATPQIERAAESQTAAEEEEEGLPFPVVAARTATSMPYEAWLRDATPSHAEQELSKQGSAQWTYQPVISIVTPVFDPPIEALRAAIESALAQTYERWELCLVDGGSKNGMVRKLLQMYAERDPRIKVQALKQNQGISGNTNAAAQMATGEFLQILDHDDMLEPHALYEVVKALNADPTLDILYFDEDKLSASGARREDPFFKPDWSPEMLLCVNYLTHCVIRRSLYQEVGGCDAAMDGTQDWDLLLKATERSQRIKHIPQVLYHWRKAPTSAAGDAGAKPYVFERQLRAVTQRLQRQGIAQGQAAFTATGRLRVTWPVTEERVSIIIPTKDKVDLLQRCIETLVSLTTYQDYEIILVDTGSVEQPTLAYYETLKTNPQLEGRFKLVQYTGQFNYSHANNLGVAEASGSLLLFLNNDTEIIEPDWLEELVRWAQRPDVGVVGTQLFFPGGEIQHAGVVMGMGGHAGHVFAGMKAHTPTMFGSPDWYRNYMAVTGACLMTRRAVFDQLGSFDEDYLLAFSDVEYCLRVHAAGYKVVYTPFACLKHHESASRGAHIPLRDIQRGFEHMVAIVEQGDPYFNPNLASGSSVPILAVNDAPQRAERLRLIVRQYEFINRK